MALLELVVGKKYKCEMPSTDISQENDQCNINIHDETSIYGLQLKINSSGTTLPFS